MTCTELTLNEMVELEMLEDAASDAADARLAAMLAEESTQEEG